MRRLARHLACIGTAAFAVVACASVSKGLDNLHDLANHKAETVTYPSLMDIPAKPTPATTPAQHKATVTSLQSDRSDAEAQAADLRAKAAGMALLPVPGQPPEPQAPATAPTPVPSPASSSGTTPPGTTTP